MQPIFFKQIYKLPWHFRARNTVLAFLCCIISFASLGQSNNRLDSLKQIIQQNRQDSTTADALFGFALRTTPDKTIEAALAALSLYEAQGDSSGQASSLLLLQGVYRNSVGQYQTSLKYAKMGLSLAGNSGLLEQKFWGVMGGQRARSLFLAEVAGTYLLMNQLDSAEYYTRAAVAENEMVNGSPWDFPIYLLAKILTIEGRHIEAENNFRKAHTLAIQNDLAWDTLQIYSGMSTLFRKMGKPDSCLKYAQMVVQTGYGATEIKNTLESVDNLIYIYRQNGNKDSILKYLDFKILVRDSLMSIEQDRKILQVTFNEHLKEQEIENRQRAYKDKVKQYSLLAGLLGLALFSFLLWRSNRQKQQSNEKINKAYHELKSTQQQLIQSEKMASLGELTAGIAHEIQNPLNFVNNFAEVNTELNAEGRDALKSGNWEGAEEIMNTLAENNEKIFQHGKRADAIVKSMLQHSHSTKREKEPTDINKLADDYLRLAFHGMRAKDKSFNCDFSFNPDPNVGLMNVVPQDIGRVILNLINNAFYAVKENSVSGNSAYKPQVEVSTHRSGDKVILTVKDNGKGIPENIRQKIFQPFFTTKPTGEGTGLGLSLSYDIVKAHGGEIKVETKEGEGTVFMIQLPANSTI
jgi:two-component system, NtrC family, sensor kinase